MLKNEKRIETIEQFKNAYLNLLLLIESDDSVLNAINNNNYPFESSFDEYQFGLIDWCNDAINNLK